VKFTKWPLSYVIWGISMRALILMMDRYPFPEMKDGKRVDDESGFMGLLSGDMETT